MHILVFKHTDIQKIEKRIIKSFLKSPFPVLIVPYSYKNNCFFPLQNCSSFSILSQSERLRSRKQPTTIAERVKGVWRKQDLICCCWDCTLVQPLWLSVWRVLRKLNVNLPYEPAVPLFVRHIEVLTSCSTDLCSAMLTAALFTAVRTWKCPEYFQLISGSENVVHPHYGI